MPFSPPVNSLGNSPSRRDPPAGYLHAMAAPHLLAFLTASSALWIFGALVATGLLAASMNRRQTGLVEVLREWTRRNTPDEDENEPTQ